LHYLILVGLIVLGTVLRFWNLDAKPLWMDEVITAIFSFGRSYQAVPLERSFPMAALDQVFSFNPIATCTSITQTISTQSVHPPLFFCWLHSWLALLKPIELSWVWKIRSLPAIAGVMMIVAMYILNRTAFSKRAGLFGALAIAVSPFAVYLSQEARHYTVPMLLILVALLGLVRIQQDLQQQSLKIGVWIGWVIANGIGFYVHYFFILAVVAQVLTLIALQFRREVFRRNVQKRLIMEGLSDVKELTWFSWKSWGAIALSIL
jgi:uncharacterized membrane protein